MATRCSRLARGIAVVLGVAAALLPAGQAVGQTPHPFTFHWAISNSTPYPGQTPRDWESLMDLSGAPFHKDVKVFYDWNTGFYPRAGVHVVEGDSDYMRRHFLKLADTINQAVPDHDWAGFAVIDYESWEFYWAALTNLPSNLGPAAQDMDFKDDWRDFVRASRPETIAGMNEAQQEEEFARQYDDAAKRFILATLNECKRLRPHAKWGYYGIPTNSYFDYVIPAWTERFRARNRTALAWLYDAQDAFYPCIYTLFYTVDGREPNRPVGEDTVDEHTCYVRENVKEAVQIANGRPVLPFMWIRYHQNAPAYFNQLLTPLNLRITLDNAKRYGADGLIVWDAMHSDAEQQAVQRYLTDTYLPMLLQYATDAQPPAAGSAGNQGSGGTGAGSPESGSGSGNTGSGNTGSGSGRTGNSGSGGSPPPTGKPVTRGGIGAQISSAGARRINAPRPASGVTREQIQAEIQRARGIARRGSRQPQQQSSAVPNGGR